MVRVSTTSQHISTSIAYCGSAHRCMPGSNTFMNYDGQKNGNNHYLPIVSSMRLLGEDQDLRHKIVSATRYSMKARVNTYARSWFLEAATQLRGLRLVEPLGDIRSLFTDLDYETSGRADEGPDEIRQDNNPRIHYWDDSSGSYGSE